MLNRAEPLTEFQGHPERCSNPFCDAPMAAKNKHASIKLACSDRCRMDRYVLRRAKAMLDEVGIVEFDAILQGHGCLKRDEEVHDEKIKRQTNDYESRN